jgi:hypothetical protein
VGCREFAVDSIERLLRGFEEQEARGPVSDKGVRESRTD